MGCKHGLPDWSLGLKPLMGAGFDGVIDGQSSQKKWAITDVDPQNTSATL